MHDTKVLSFELNGMEIKTTITDQKKVIDEHISSFLRPTDNHGTKVIGFDTEWRKIIDKDQDGTNSRTKPGTIQLCDGHSCLIIELHYCFRDYNLPLSLLNFLRQPNYTFVGCGIKDNFINLEKHHGIGSRNAVELGPLAAKLMKMPRLSYCGVDELAFVVNKLDLRKYRPSDLDFDWQFICSDEELARLATVNVYSYHKIGSTLLESNMY
ncbi:putative ribonuclease H-like domain-containing protein [Medicago truncatula]|uniref:Putative ribonuclease H-like domain-containing protein n=1 Tax=Medicago truncatula TaxID=3880 RepID=A0A396GWU8_MEDTR|nr:uncharacterized protein LOC112420001 [Medicago truncatula]RHN45606.1 putative ribonuclease H-like domain-containing protein [Medicago truncatula]